MFTRLALISATLALTACDVSVGGANAGFSTSTTSSNRELSPSEKDGFVRCPNRPGKMVKPGMEDALCYS